LWKLGEKQKTKVNESKGGTTREVEGERKREREDGG
jgi:hypothetical protein